MSGRRERAERRANKVVFFLPDPDQAPDGMVNTMRLREQATMDGECPVCGAMFEIETMDDKVFMGVMHHAPNCVVGTDPPEHVESMRDAMRDLARRRGGGDA